MEQPEQERERVGTRSTRNLASNLLAVAAVIFAILAVLLYVRGSRVGVAPIPTPAAGALQVVNVTEALKAEGLAIAQPRGLFIPATRLGTPGQGLEIDGVPAFIFLFKDADSARAALEGVAPDSLVPARLAGTPVPPGERHLARGREVAILVVGGDATLWQKVDDALAKLP